MTLSSKPFTIHTARTLMIAELSQILDHAGYDQMYALAIENNVTGKRTQANRQRSYIALKKLYRFDPTHLPFAALVYFWSITEPTSRPLLVFQYALGHDYLLSESLPLVAQATIGSTLSVARFDANLSTQHPNLFTPITQYSISKNLASSYKQAGYLTGKVKVFRIPIKPTLPVVIMAFLMAYLNGDRGEFLFQSQWVKALEQDTENLHKFLILGSQKGWLTYQRAGLVISISFDSLLQQLSTHGHQN